MMVNGGERWMVNCQDWLTIGSWGWLYQRTSRCSAARSSFPRCLAAHLKAPPRGDVFSSDECPPTGSTPLLLKVKNVKILCPTVSNQTVDHWCLYVMQLPATTNRSHSEINSYATGFTPVMLVGFTPRLGLFTGGALCHHSHSPVTLPRCERSSTNFASGRISFNPRGQAGRPYSLSQTDPPSFKVIIWINMVLFI